MEHQGLVGVQRERGLSLLRTLSSPDASMPGLAHLDRPRRPMMSAGIITDCGPLCLSVIRYGTASDHSRSHGTATTSRKCHPILIPCHVSYRWINE
ncbi:hypothetical protein BO83DRAFT_19982 [Aspergillus eucalypticola CBS 122712]|uniref:Uncharacterized protein n=1 Tax=Aspergillus eucalypticola (strain CBS 122712 / IBT 29274) TaxID=1448314 RepID=A0A317VPI8_ASPEC|nr:uncharacterized protein BO83DRAFT_19982 [Aspergillus eucalypticola CBS 122712]PWY74977.1 hypothetical protein BO83DRAFT_19982 [Aspergillus eucalypticola CBS 122712]